MKRGYVWSDKGMEERKMGWSNESRNSEGEEGGEKRERGGMKQWEEETEGRDEGRREKEGGRYNKKPDFIL